MRLNKYLNLNLKHVMSHVECRALTDDGVIKYLQNDAFE